MDIKGKTAVVFGGTSGIGLATVRMLADKGAAVTAIGRSPDKASALPQGVGFKACDTTDSAAVEAALADCAPYDILISAATGGDRAVGPFLEMDIEGFMGSFAKMRGYANVVRYGVPHLPDDGCCVLVSGSPARRTRPGQVAIGAVGGAVENFARTVAREITPKRLNVVAPGFIDTPMVPLQGQERDDLYAKITAPNLIPRAGRPEEVAQGILFCVENDFITGTTVDVDGGLINA